MLQGVTTKLDPPPSTSPKDDNMCFFLFFKPMDYMDCMAYGGKKRPVLSHRLRHQRQVQKGQAQIRSGRQRPVGRRTRRSRRSRPDGHGGEELRHGQGEGRRGVESREEVPPGSGNWTPNRLVALDKEKPKAAKRENREAKSGHGA